MNVAIDIDGTLTAHPKVIKDLVVALEGRSHQIVFITGCASGSPEKEDLVALNNARKYQVKELTGAYYEVHVCVGRNSREVALQKAEYCLKNGITLFIDDSKDYCDAVMERSPKTVVLHLCNKE